MVIQNKIGADIPVQTGTIVKNGRTLTVVEAGPFNTKEEAQKALITLNLSFLIFSFFSQN